jgi:hypothetical protein
VTASIMSQPGMYPLDLKNVAVKAKVGTDLTLIEFTEVFMQGMGRDTVVNSGKTMFSPA